MATSDPGPSPDTHYTRTGVSGGPRAFAEGVITTDVAIVGGGLAGLSLARNLAAVGKAPVLLEAKSIAFGASGRNGGFVTPGYACDHRAIERKVGTDAAAELFRLSLDGVDAVRARAESFDPREQVGLTDGILSVRRLPGEDALRRHRDWLGGFGYETEYLDAKEVRARTCSPKYFDALRSDRAFHIHPLNYARALAREAQSLGAEIYEDSPALGLHRTTDGHVITTPDARIHAAQVVITTGGYTGHLLPALKHAYVPVATYVMATEPAPDLLSTAIRTSDGISDNRRANNYYRLVEARSRLLWGGAITVRDRDPAAITRYLRQELVETYPQLQGLGVEVSWSGWMSYARHRMPQIGQWSPGLWYATAFGGHGLNTTALAAQLIGEAITDGSDRWRLFAPWGLPWTGGPVGRVAAQATYRWLQWRDRQQEAAAR